jgi:hypothetical protein
MPSRRQVLAALASGMTTGVAGCSTGIRSTATSNSTTIAASDSTTDGTAVAASSSPHPSTPTTPTTTGTPGPDGGFRLVLVDTATDTTTELVTGNHVSSAGEVRDTRDGYGVPLSLTDAGTTRFAEAFRAADVAAEASAHEIRLVVDAEEQSTFGVAPGLAHAIQSGDWDGELLVQVGDRATAERLRRIVTA